MKKYLLLIPIIFGLSACESQQQHVAKYEKIRIIDIKPPKRFRVKYQIISTGQIKSDYTKRCSSWRTVKEGGIYIADTNKSGCSLIKSIKK